MEPLPKFKSEKIFGRNACWAVWNCRPQDVMRVALTEESVGPFSQMLKEFAAKKIAYKIVDEEELRAIAGKDHHEGICLQVRAKKVLGEESISKVISSNNVIICMDGVGNPHNFGALVRSAANFGVKTILGDSELPSLSGAGSRVAEGAGEFVDLLKVEDIVDALADFKDGGFTVFALDNKGGKSLYETGLPKKSLFIMGAEGRGLSSGLKKIANAIITIPGTGVVDSLNVSVATALVLGEYWRQHGSGKEDRPRGDQNGLHSSSGAHKRVPRRG